MMEQLVCPLLQEARKHLLDKRAARQSRHTSIHTARILPLYIPVTFQ